MPYKSVYVCDHCGKKPTELLNDPPVKKTSHQPLITFFIVSKIEQHTCTSTERILYVIDVFNTLTKFFYIT